MQCNVVMLPTEFKRSEDQSAFQTIVASWEDEVDKEEKGGKLITSSRSLSSYLNPPQKRMPSRTSLKHDLEKLIINKIFRSDCVDNKHTKALFLNVDFEGVRLGKVLLDTGATVNIMSFYVFKLGKTRKDFHNIQINITDFFGLSEKAERMAILKIKVGT